MLSKSFCSWDNASSRTPWLPRSVSELTDFLATRIIHARSPSGMDRSRHDCRPSPAAGGSHLFCRNKCSVRQHAACRLMRLAPTGSLRQRKPVARDADGDQGVVRCSSPSVGRGPNSYIQQFGGRTAGASSNAIGCHSCLGARPIGSGTFGSTMLQNHQGDRIAAPAFNDSGMLLISKAGRSAN